MPAFRLTPNPDRTWHADWMASRHAGPCLVWAHSTYEARKLAARRFATPAGFASPPWRRVDLVHVERIPEPRLPPFPAGTVLPVLSQACG